MTTNNDTQFTTSTEAELNDEVVITLTRRDVQLFDHLLSENIDVNLIINAFKERELQFLTR